MKTCPNCHAELDDSNAFCSNCGAPLNGQPQYQPPMEPIINPYDHTEDYEETDIQANRLYAMLCYLLGPVGVIIALLAGSGSAYLKFQMRNALRFIVLEAVTLVLTLVLCWTFVVPILGGIGMALILVAKVIAFVEVCRSKVMDPWLIRSISFLQ